MHSMCRFLSCKHISEKYATLFADLYYMMEKDYPCLLDQGPPECKKHKQSTCTLAHGMQGQSHITDFFHRPTSLLTCLRVIIERTKECWWQWKPQVPRYKAHESYCQKIMEIIARHAQSARKHPDTPLKLLHKQPQSTSDMKPRNQSTACITIMIMEL